MPRRKSYSRTPVPPQPSSSSSSPTVEESVEQTTHTSTISTPNTTRVPATPTSAAASFRRPRSSGSVLALISATPQATTMKIPKDSKVDSGFVDESGNSIIIEQNEVDGLWKCPLKKCGKNFRKDSLLKMHFKHYHFELKTTGEVANVVQMAQARTAFDGYNRIPTVKVSSGPGVASTTLKRQEKQSRSVTQVDGNKPPESPLTQLVMEDAFRRMFQTSSGHPSVKTRVPSAGKEDKDVAIAPSSSQPNPFPSESLPNSVRLKQLIQAILATSETSYSPKLTMVQPQPGVQPHSGMSESAPLDSETRAEEPKGLASLIIEQQCLSAPQTLVVPAPALTAATDSTHLQSTSSAEPSNRDQPKAKLLIMARPALKRLNRAMHNLKREISRRRCERLRLCLLLKKQRQEILDERRRETDLKKQNRAKLEKLRQELEARNQKALDALEVELAKKLKVSEAECWTEKVNIEERLRLADANEQMLLKQATRESEKAEAEKDLVLAELESLKKKYKEATLRKAQLVSRATAMVDVEKEPRGRREEMEKRVAELREKHGMLKADVEEAQRVLNLTKRRHEEIEKPLWTEKTDLWVSVEIIKSQNEIIEKKITESNKRIEQLEREKTELATTLAEKKVQMNSLRAELEEGCEGGG